MEPDASCVPGYVGEHDCRGAERAPIVFDAARGAAEHIGLRGGPRHERTDHARLAGADLAEHRDVEFFSARAPVEFLEFGLQCCRIRVLVMQAWPTR